jgi:hemerythrin-like domain-containing protein
LRVQKIPFPKETLPQPEIGGDLVRVHRSISRAVDVAHTHAAQYASRGYPDQQTLKGYLTYVKCLVRLLHAHHITEDKAMFPHLRDMLPDAPIQELTAQHLQMDPLLKEIKGILNRTKSAKPTATMDLLEDVLYRTKMLWRKHIKQEEAAFGPEAIEPYISMAERRRAGRITANYSARHQFPLSLILPFLLYNMTLEDRGVMLQLMPPFIPFLLVVWKSRWKVMAPFLLTDR